MSEIPDDIMEAASACAASCSFGGQVSNTRLIAKFLMTRDERAAVMAENFAQECEDDGRFTACADFLRLATAIRTQQEK